MPSSLITPEPRLRPARLLLYVATLYLGLGLSGCASSAPPPLDNAVRELHRAIERGDAGAVNKLLTSAGRSERSEEELAALLALHREELLQIARRLESQTPVVEAHLRIAGEEIGFIYEGGGYRLNGAAIGGLSLKDPESLVLALRRAIGARDLKALLRLLTHERRMLLLAQLDGLAEAGKDPLDLEVDAAKTSATVRLPSGALLQLKYENGEWRLFELRF